MSKFLAPGDEQAPLMILNKQLSLLTALEFAL